MEISKTKLDEFMALYRKEFGEDITHEEALERGIALLQLVKLANNKE